MLILTGTCAEIEGDEQLQRKKPPSKDAATETEESGEKKATEKKVSQVPVFIWLVRP